MLKRAEKIDFLIRNGNSPSALEHLLDLTRKKIPRNLLQKIVALTRRTGIPEIGVRLLHSTIRPPQGKPSNASVGERMEYARCLIKVGAVDEGLALLKSLEPTSDPELLLSYCSALVSKWEYEQAIPLYLRALENLESGSYERAIAEVNLAAAYVSEHQIEQADRLLADLNEVTSKSQWVLLRGTVLLLCSENAFLERKWTAVELYLNEARFVLSQVGGTHEFLVRKWAAILQAVRSGGSPSSLSGLIELKEEAKACKYWESLRDLERYQALSTRNSHLITHVYYGTPYPSYRRQLFGSLGWEIEIPDRYFWKLGGTDEGGNVLHLVTGAVNGVPTSMKSGQLPLVMLQALVSDFYRPHTLASLHSTIYHGEYYNPLSSPLKFYQTARRLRKLFTENELPIKIEECGGRYRLSSKLAVRIVIPKTLPPLMAPTDGAIEKILAAWPGGIFSIQQVSQLLGVSTRTAQRTLVIAQQDGRVERLGRGRVICYRACGKNAP